MATQPARRTPTKATALLAAALLLATLVPGCAGKDGGSEEAAATPPARPQVPCDEVFVYAPGNFVVDLAAGSVVSLDPSVATFPVFCSAADARAAVDRKVSKGELPAGNWRIYRLKGTFSEIGTATGPEEFRLARRADMADWVQE